MNRMGQVKPVSFYLYGEFLFQEFVDDSDIRTGSYRAHQGIKYKVIRTSKQEDGLRADVVLAKPTYTNLARKNGVKKKHRLG
jgi:hypothetical protein